MVRDGEEDATMARVKRERGIDRHLSAVAELVSVKEADRAVKAATKRKGFSPSGTRVNAARVAKPVAKKGPSAKVAKRR